MKFLGMQIIVGKHRACRKHSGKSRQVVFKRRWKPWRRYIRYVCIECLEYELEQQRLASGGW